MFNVSCVQSFDAQPDIYWPYCHGKKNAIVGALNKNAVMFTLL